MIFVITDEDIITNNEKGDIFVINDINEPIWAHEKYPYQLPTVSVSKILIDKFYSSEDRGE